MRARHFRFIHVRLECGHSAFLNTGRYRVSRALAACLFGDAVRRGKWCFACGATCQPTELVAVVSGEGFSMSEVKPAPGSGRDAGSAGKGVSAS